MVISLPELLERGNAEVDALADDLAYSFRRLWAHVAQPRRRGHEQPDAVVHRLHRERHRHEAADEQKPREHERGGDDLVGDQAAAMLVGAARAGGHAAPHGHELLEQEARRRTDDGGPAEDPRERIPGGEVGADEEDKLQQRELHKRRHIVDDEVDEIRQIHDGCAKRGHRP